MRILLLLLCLASVSHGDYNRKKVFKPARPESVLVADMDTNMTAIVNDSTESGYNAFVWTDNAGNFYRALADSQDGVHDDLSVIDTVTACYGVFDTVSGFLRGETDSADHANNSDSLGSIPAAGYAVLGNTNTFTMRNNFAYLDSDTFATSLGYFAGSNFSWGGGTDSYTSYKNGAILVKKDTPNFSLTMNDNGSLNGGTMTLGNIGGSGAVGTYTAILQADDIKIAARNSITIDSGNVVITDTATIPLIDGDVRITDASTLTAPNYKSGSDFDFQTTDDTRFDNTSSGGTFTAEFTGDIVLETNNSANPGDNDNITITAFDTTVIKGKASIADLYLGAFHFINYGDTCLVIEMSGAPVDTIPAGADH